MSVELCKTTLRKAATGAVVCVALSAGLPGTAASAVIGYVSNPTGNSIDWGNAVTGLGATINSGINFNTMSVGALNGSYYAASQGVTMSQTGNVVVGSSYGGNGWAISPASQGEGAWSPSNLLLANSYVLSTTPAQSVTFSFENDVYGAGIFLVDYMGATAWTITARDENGNVLGSYTSITGTSFHKQGNPPIGPFTYFMGIESTEGDIASVTFSRPSISMYTSGDIVGLDNFRFATLAPASVPEPASIALLGLGLLGMGAVRRRTAK